MSTLLGVGFAPEVQRATGKPKTQNQELDEERRLSVISTLRFNGTGGSGVSLPDLARSAQVEELHLKRIMRALIAEGFAEELNGRYRTRDARAGRR